MKSSDLSCGCAMDETIYQPVAAEILDIRRETAIDWTFRLAWTSPPLPGQFFQVSVPGAGEAPISASGWGDGWVELTIRKVGKVTGAIFTREAGACLHLRGPYGRSFPLNAFAGRQVIVAAGGTGLAPVRGLIGRLLDLRGEDGGPSEVVVLAGFKSTADMLFADDLGAWSRKTRTLYTVDRAEAGWPGHVGVVTTLIPDIEISDLDALRVVVVGPPLMMKYTIAAFLDRGVGANHIWLSYERHMSCGLGKCGHCKINDTYVCLDGPVFTYEEAKRLID